MTDPQSRPSTPAASTRAAPSGVPRGRWRTVDIVVGSVLGVAFGVLFAGWNNLVYPAISAPLSGSPLGPLLAGVWLLPGVVGGLVLRRVGAAFYVELVAATVSLLFGSVWGLTVFASGLVQGAGAEAGFRLTRYRRWGVGTAVLAGTLSGLAMGIYETLVYVASYSTGAKLVYVLAGGVTGAVAGVLGWLLVRALARSGALSPFASGRGQDEV
jgi:energy-coupling factor transport system substrate-specific component